MVFLSKLNEGISTGEEHKATAASVKATEEKFYRAVFPGSEYQHGVSDSSSSHYTRFSFFHSYIDCPPPLQPFKAFTRESTVAGAATGPLLPGILPARFPFQIPVFNPENFSKPMLPVIAPTPTPIPTIGSGSVPTRVQQAPETAPTNVTPPVDQAKLLHQSYMNALKQKSSAPVAAAATSQAQSTQHAQASSSMGAGVRPPMPAPTGHTNVPSSEPSVHPRGSAPPKTNELPDFLTGFDKVTCIFKHGAAQGTATTDAPPTVGIPPYSPPFTSRSFDDFHRVLGKGWCPLDETVDQKTSSSSTRDPQQPHSSLASTAQTSQSILEIDTMALFTAESYAMFAQESAMAASQHAAYFQPGDAGFASRTHSLEAEGLMNVISDQIEDRQRYANQQNVQPEPSQANSLAGACISSNGLTPVERLYGTRDMNVVSGSEPSSSATETESNSLSMHGSSSDRDVSDNTSNDFATDNALSSNDSEGSSSDYQSDDSPQRKKIKRTTMTVEKRERGAERS
jgi:hypothetical protein